MCPRPSPWSESSRPLHCRCNPLLLIRAGLAATSTRRLAVDCCAAALEKALKQLTDNPMKLLDFLLKQERDGVSADTIRSAAWEKFGTKVAVLNIDSVGFSRTTKSHGIVHFLTRMAKARQCMSAILQEAKAIRFGYHADNCIAYFATPRLAVNAAIALQQGILDSGLTLNDTEKYGLCAGIGFGDLLYSETLDGYFGDEMNLASRLGEDVAERDEILLTQGAYDALETDPSWAFDTRALDASGVHMSYYALLR